MKSNEMKFLFKKQNKKWLKWNCSEFYSERCGNRSIGFDPQQIAAVSASADSVAADVTATSDMLRATQSEKELCKWIAIRIFVCVLRLYLKLINHVLYKRSNSYVFFSLVQLHLINFVESLNLRFSLSCNKSTRGIKILSNDAKLHLAYSENDKWFD